MSHVRLRTMNVVLAVAACAAVVLHSQQVRAANYTWTGVDNATWNTTGTNWTPAGATWSANTHTAVFDSAQGNSGGTVLVSSTVSTAGLLVNAGNYTLTGGAISLNGNVINNGSGTLTFGTGSSALNLNNAVRFNGNFVLANGTFTSNYFFGIGHSDGGGTPGGTFTQTGGVVNSARGIGALTFVVGRATSGTSIYNLNGGSVNLTGAAIIGFLNTGTATSTLNITGGTMTLFQTLSSSTTNYLQIGATTGSGTATLNMTGGELRGMLISTKSNSTDNGQFLFSGGILRPSSGGNLAIGNATNSALSVPITLTGTGGVVNSTDSGTSAPTARQVDIYSNIREDATGGRGITYDGAGLTVLYGTNSYTGRTLLLGGTVRAASSTALGTGGNITFSGATLQYTGSSSAQDWSSRIKNSGSAISVDTNSQNVAFAGVIDSSNTGGLVKSGSGTLTLSGTNTYSGQTRVSAGVLALGASNAISNQSNLLVDGGGFNLAGFSDTLGTVTLTSGSIFGSGTLGGTSYALQGGSLNAVLGTGPITVSTGTTTLGSAGRFHSASAMTISSGQVTLGGSESVASFTLFGGILAGSGNTLTSGSAYDVQSGSVLASLGGSVGLRKSTVGAVTLAGSNTYAGMTTISAGTLTLDVNGSFNASPTITIGDAGSSGAVLDLSAKASGFSFGSGQTVKGIGTIQMASGKALTINGTLAAGNSPGTLTISGGDLILGGSSVTNYEINGTDATVGSSINDLTRVAGSLTLGGTLNVSASPAFDRFGSRTYRIFDYATGGSGSLSGTGSMAIGTTPSTDYLYSLTNTATTVNLVLQRKAEQAATLAFSLPTSGTVNAFTSTNVSFSGTLANLTPSGGKDLAVSLAGNGGQVSVGSLSASSGSTVAGATTAMITGEIATGTALGARTWSVVNTDTTALGSTTSTANGVVNVFAHGTPALSTSSITFGRVLAGTTASQTVTVSNGTSSAANTGGITWTAVATPSGFGTGGAAQAGVVASGSGVTYTYTLATGSAAIYSGSQAFSFNDDASILGNGSLGALTVSLSGTVVNQRSFSLSTGTISLGNFLRTATVTGSTTISSSGSFSTTASGTLGTFNGTSTNGFMLGTADSPAFNGGLTSQSATFRISGSASSAGAITGSFTSTVSAELGTIAPIAVALTGTAFDTASISANNGAAVGNNGTISITNAGGLSRSAANVASTSLTGQGWSVTGFGAGSSAAAGATLAATAQFNTAGLLSGTYTGQFTAWLQNDQNLAGAGTNDLGSVSWILSQVVLNSSGSGQTALVANSLLNTVSLSSGTGAAVTLASFGAGQIGASPSTVIMSFTSGSTGQYSDILHLQGTDGLAQVLQLSYDPGSMDLTQQHSLLLGWLDTRTGSPTNGQWINSVFGNSGTNGVTMESPFLGSWATYASQSGKTAETALGAFGVDTATKTVWAAINHNSQFVVIVPEPNTLIFAGIGIAMAGWSLRKRRRLG